MNAKEFLESKGIKEDPNRGIIFTYESELISLLDEYHSIASGQKIDLDKKFENLTEKYEKEKNQ